MGTVCSCNKDTQADELIIENESKINTVQNYNRDAADTLEDECRVTIEFLPLADSNPNLALSLTAQSLARGWLGRQTFKNTVQYVDMSKRIQTMARRFLARKSIKAIKKEKLFGLFPYIEGSIESYTTLSLSTLESTSSGRIQSILKSCKAVLLPSSEIYQGEWCKDTFTPNGFGISKSPDNSTYVGNFTQGERTGLGWLHFEDGSLYEGSFSDGVMNGKGTLRFPEGRVISGFFQKGYLEGEGKEAWDSGALYEGTFVKSKKQGKGILVVPKFSNYEGGFYKDKFHGVGKLAMENQTSYEGEWKNGMMHGKGIFVWPNGKVYTGDYVNDVKHGNGRMKYPNKSIYNGEWANDLQNGKAIYTFFDKKKNAFKSYNSFWENGNRVTFMKKDGKFFEVSD